MLVILEKGTMCLQTDPDTENRAVITIEATHDISIGFRMKRENDRGELDTDIPHENADMLLTASVGEIKHIITALQAAVAVAGG